MIERKPWVPRFYGEEATAALYADMQAAQMAAGEIVPGPAVTPAITAEDIKCEGDRLTVLRGALAAANLLSDPDQADQAILAAYASEGRVKVSARDEIEDLKAQSAEIRAELAKLKKAKT